MSKQEFSVAWPGREQAKIEFNLDASGAIQSFQLTGIGGPEFLDTLKVLRNNIKGELKNIPLPQGTSSSAILLRELMLRARGEFEFPFKEEELCHCRAVPAATVDQAICFGAHSPQKVSEQTSASTACGTCRPDVESIIQFRLKTK